MSKSESVRFSGLKYEVRVVNEGTEQERVVIYKKWDGGNSWDRPWKKPLTIGG